MKKLSQFVEKIIPLLSAASSVDLGTGQQLYQGSIENLSKLITAYLKNLYSYKDQNCLNTEIVVVNDSVAKQFSREINLSSFSFDIDFVDCGDLKCNQLRSKFEYTGSEGRPVITITAGRTPAFLVFVDANLVPLVCFNLYHKNMTAWAGRIGLRGTRKQRTDNPSTHFVFREHAESTGLLWMNRHELKDYHLNKHISLDTNIESHIVVEFDYLDHEHHHEFPSLELAIEKLEALTQSSELENLSTPILPHPDGSGKLYDLEKEDWV